jgi:hypothetical protein
MRYVALALILLSFPLFVAWLQSMSKNRDIATMLLGALVFAGGSLQLDAAFITWPMWPGTSRGITISPSDTLALALLFTRKRNGKVLPFTWLMSAYLAVLIVSATYSRVPMASFFAVWDFSRVFLAFIVIGGELARPTAYSALLRGFSVGLIVQVGYVIEQKLSGVVQASGTMSHQNLLGMMTELVFLNLFAAMLEGERSWLVRLGALSGVVIVAAGGSRGALGLMGGATVVLMVLSLIRSRTSVKVTIAATGVAVLLAATPIAMITLKDRFGELTVTTEETQREAMERAARAISKDHPFGVGANLYTTVSNMDGYAARAGVSWFGANLTVPAHNAYLVARAELGYHGEAVFALLMLVPMAAGLAHAFRHRRERSDGWTLGPATALGAVAIHSSFEFNTYIYVVLLPLGMNIAIVASRIRAARLGKLAQRSAERGPEDERRGADSHVAQLPRVPSMRMVAPVGESSENSGLTAGASQEIKR